MPTRHRPSGDLGRLTHPGPYTFSRPACGARAVSPYRLRLSVRHAVPFAVQSKIKNRKSKMPSFAFFDSPSFLADALRARFTPPVALVGVGNALRGDDGFGPAVVASLRGTAGLALFDVQAVPESFLVPIVSSGASSVLFVDAADLGADPGRVALVPAERLAEVDVSTHAISLSLIAEAIQGLARGQTGRDLPCALLAVQPADLSTPDRLSPAVSAAVRLASDALRLFARADG